MAELAGSMLGERMLGDHRVQEDVETDVHQASAKFPISASNDIPTFSASQNQSFCDDACSRICISASSQRQNFRTTFDSERRR